MLMSRQSRLGSGSDADHATDTLSMTRFRKVDPKSPVAPRAGSVPVAHPRDIAEIRTRIAKATLDCSTWRAAGFSEEYLEACSLMEALEVEMKALGGAQVSAQTREVLHIPDIDTIVWTMPSTMRSCSAPGARTRHGFPCLCRP
jgi:hypothetical protein